MKKVFITLFASAIVGMAMAQDVKTYSVYDTNQSGDLTIADVTATVNQVKSSVSATSTQQYVTADDLSTLLKDIQRRLSKIEEKLGIDDSGSGDSGTDTHEYVDLGLTSGTLWAKTNIGAETETGYGLYFAWGETTGYTSDTSDGRSFDWASYKWMASGQSSWSGCTKYTFADDQTDGCWYSNGTYVGTTVDGKTYTNLTELESSDDAATANWGSNWCMPTHAQMQELVSGTDCSWTTIDGVSGYKFANKSDASKYIFLPAAGYRGIYSLGSAGSYGYYWSRLLSSFGSSYAWDLGFYSGYIDADEFNDLRYCGLSVRAVRVQN